MPWVKPTPTGGGWKYYINISHNKFFILQHKKENFDIEINQTFDDLPVARIILRNFDQYHKVAEAERRENIEGEWDWIQHSLLNGKKQWTHETLINFFENAYTNNEKNFIEKKDIRKAISLLDLSDMEDVLSQPPAIDLATSESKKGSEKNKMEDIQRKQQEIATEVVKLHDSLQKLSDNIRQNIGALFASCIFTLIIRMNDDWLMIFLNRLLEHLRLSDEIREAILNKKIEYDKSQLNNITTDTDSNSPTVDNNPEWNIICSVLTLVATMDKHYDARARTFLLTLSEKLSIDWNRVQYAEDAFAIELRNVLDDKIDDKNNTKSNGRWWKIALAAVGGGVALSLTGGAAAPLVAGLIKIIGLGGALASFNTGLAAIGLGGVNLLSGLFGVAGAGLAGYKMDKRTGGVEEFEFQRIKGNGMHLTVACSGWLVEDETFESQWKEIHQMFNFGEHYILKWESENLKKIGTAFQGFHKKNYNEAKNFLEKASAAYSNAMAVSSALWQLTLAIDHPWHIVMDRAEKCGKLLANVLINKTHGDRPITLLGFSFGSVVIFNCLLELFKRNVKGVIENAIFIGSPISVAENEWKNARKVVSGRLINVYSKYDWVISVMFKAANGFKTSAGLTPVLIPYIDNEDMTDLMLEQQQFNNHLLYPGYMLDILKYLQKKNLVIT